MKKKYAFIAVLMLIVFFLINYLVDAGVFKNIGNSNWASEMNCHKLGDMQGPEDLALAGDHLIISSGFHKPYFKYTKQEGGLFYLNLKEKPLKEVPLNLKKDFYFNPHGIDTLQISDNVLMIYAINHREKFDTIEKFKFYLDSKKIEHLGSVGDLDLNYMHFNDIAIVSKDQYFVSEESKWKSPLFRNLFKYARIGTGRLIYFNKDKVKKVWSGFFYTNGLEYDHVRSELYVAEMLSMKITKFSWKLQLLRKKQEFQVEGGPDNLYFDEANNSLYVASHPKIFDLKRHSENVNSFNSPSQITVLNMNMKESKKTIMSSDPRLSAISIALPYKDKLVLGNIFKKGLEICRSPFN